MSIRLVANRLPVTCRRIANPKSAIGMQSAMQSAVQSAIGNRQFNPQSAIRNRQ
jgi:hypothetical protein